MSALEIAEHLLTQTGERDFDRLKASVCVPKTLSELMT